MRRPIRHQLLLPLLTLLVGIVGISTWTAVASARRAREQIEHQVRSVARTLSEASFPLNQRVLEHMKGLSGAEYVLDSPEGRWTTLPAEPPALPPIDALTDDWESLQLGPRVTVGADQYLASGVRLRQPGATLHILYPESLWRDALWEAIRPSLVVGSFVGLASLALAIGVSHRLGRRIQELERRTRLIAAGDFSPMPLAGRDDELRDLGQSVNEMAQRLAQLQEAMRKNERLRLLGQVSGGLAHQLRNGVTGAKLAVQLHARECAGGADGEALEVALRQLALVEANLKRFLDLGRTQAPSLKPCSLTAILDEVVGLLRPQCRHLRTELRWQPPGGQCTIQGDAGQMRHLLLNVVGNAVEAAGPRGWVEVGLTADASCRQAAVRVLDSGPGPPAEVADRLFEPFVTGKREGVGLGLAVARQVVEAHGGRISWRRNDKPTCFEISLPMADLKVVTENPQHAGELAAPGFRNSDEENPHC